MAPRSGKDLAKIAKELKAMDDKAVLKGFRKELRKAAAPLVPAVRASIRAIPSSRPYSPNGLRGQMSRATTLQAKTTGKQASVVIRVDGRKMAAGAKAVQAYMEGIKKPWRHPVYGNTEAWVTQQPHPYFYKVVRTVGPRARLAVARVMDDITKKIT
ncbi:hypothetical protein RVR_5828 [Actinacidiphila reveromycinica]|uniref:HK97 gp10 family phage protein n=1 Tax=Actinacidiphila reveromycinica TaxID=659352 RepID=A0A7U3UV29_9ACTN|nr:hypothetical protein [Streptomyces sp. SN-593]BBA99280.1 hypothetical protein RVR_5828 [Streptomyces sp. SN-593]